ncbi:MAG: hypothetical protein JSS76_06610 [Bacteroidetes bacterium]|nr:hypothetical protein [Bacteroidota bacterium]
MSNQWKQKDIPHKGWNLIDVIDVREDGQEEWETDYETCMMCGNEKIRYVHIVTHEDVAEDFRVGCVCAEKMTSDYFTPKHREQALRNRASRRANWPKRKWKLSMKGAYYLKVEERIILIYRDKKSNKYKVKVGDTFGKKQFSTLDEAKIAAFNGMEYLKDRGEW